MKISIITVCFNSLDALKKTLDSVLAQEIRPFEMIIIDGASTDGTKDFLESLDLAFVKWISEKDKGPYDAMNKGIRLAKGSGILFLNSGDYFEGQVLKFVTSIPCHLPVKYCRFGVLSLIKEKSFKQGMPYNHQGILFENKQLTYDLNLKIAADYKFYLEHGYRFLPSCQAEGYVYYDNFGMSSQQAERRDQEIAKIIEIYFGSVSRDLFKLKSSVKRCIKPIISSASSHFLKQKKKN